MPYYLIYKPNFANIFSKISFTEKGALLNKINETCYMYKGQGYYAILRTRKVDCGNFIARFVNSAIIAAQTAL